MDFRAVVLRIGHRPVGGDTDDRATSVVIGELPALEATLVHREVIEPDAEQISATAAGWVGRCDVLITLGGLGLGPEGVVPEALAPLIDRPLPGFGELMRARTQAPSSAAALWRCAAGVAGRTLVIWLPGEPKVVGECIALLAQPIRDACRELKQK